MPQAKRSYFMLFQSKKKKAEAERARITALCAKDLQYVTLRDCAENTEVVIGKSGYINYAVAEEMIYILCDGKPVFAKPVSELTVGELLSKNGSTFTYVDSETGKRMTVVAYYNYYRK